VNDPYRLQRFINAQDADNGKVYQDALSELRGGRKITHWIWFVFPQIAGLGQSPTSEWYAISGLPEARAYLAHPVLGPRLIECVRILTAISGRTASQIFGATDTKKLRSSMTLFAHAAPDNPLFQQILDRYFSGSADSKTHLILEQVDRSVESGQSGHWQDRS
jgi:uncharacterized protein (DUF1810 family)